MRNGRSIPCYPKVIVVSTKRSGSCGQKLCTFNAGAYGSDVSRIFQSAEIVLETGEWVRYSKEDREFAYYHSVMH